jgi:tryptophan halogenase
VVIAGGGTAGWMAAAALARKLGQVLEVSLVESDAIGTIGVGESTIPPIRVFHQILGIDEQEFMRETQASFKLGISFEGWLREGEQYYHSFGKVGQQSWMADFVHYWLRGREAGVAGDFGDYCLELQAARAAKFATSPNSPINYAYHLDATRYAAFLRRLAERHGLRRIEGRIARVDQHPDSGDIASLTLDSGQVVEGDLFIDCTGFRALLIEQTLHTGFEDWSHWLPCNSSVAVQTRSVGPAVPYTRAMARSAGWQWRIPLQTRVGNGLVFSNDYLSDDEGVATLLGHVQGEVLTEPRVIKFTTGRRRQAWNRNCIALGLSSGFIEPLESTSIHLFMIGVSRLLKLFPFDGIHPSTVAEFNHQSRTEAERIRDFIILHYHVNQRQGEPFWQRCREMSVPETLVHRIDLFRESAQAFQAEGEVFRVDSWNQVLMGQGVMPASYHPIAQLMTEAELRQFLGGIRHRIAETVERLPAHQDFLQSYCRADAHGAGAPA